RTGSVSGEGTQDVTVGTAGKGEAKGNAALAIGAMFAFSSVGDAVAVRADGQLTTTGGNVGLRSKGRSKSKTNSTASAAGASDKGKNVDQQAGAEKQLAQDQGGQGSPQDTPSAKTSDGPI